MKWIKKNWAKILLLIFVLLAGWFWYGNFTSNKTIEENENDISLRNDTIALLEIKNSVLKQQRVVYEDSINLLEVKSDKQEEEISSVKKELIAEKQRIKNLSPTENVKMLSNNLSRETKQSVSLKLQENQRVPYVELTIVNVEVINEVFAERDYGLKELAKTKILLSIKLDQIEAQGLLIDNLKSNINVLEKTMAQKNMIILDQEEIIKEKDTDIRKGKIKSFFIGFGLGFITGAGIVIL